MASYKDPGFKERTALAAEQRKKAIDALKSRPPVDPAVLVARQEAAAAKEAAAAQRRADKLAEQAAKIAEKEAAIAAAAALVEQTEAQKKAERDARYAARKNRK